MDQFVSQNVDLVLIGQHSFGQRAPFVNITFSLPDHRAVVHFKEKNLQMLGSWGRPGGVLGRG